MLIAARVISNQNDHGLSPKHTFTVHYNFEIDSDSAFWVKSYLPLIDIRQTISYPDYSQLNKGFISIHGGNKVIKWNKSQGSQSNIHYSFQFEGKSVTYQLSPKIPYLQNKENKMSNYLTATSLVQSQDEEICLPPKALRAPR